MANKPKHIRATRQGLGESEYDAYGELAPLQWRCRCGSVLYMEVMDKMENWVQTSKELVDYFLAKHADCHAITVYCYSCKEVEVERYGNWCDRCSDNCSDWY